MVMNNKNNNDIKILNKLYYTPDFKETWNNRKLKREFKRITAKKLRRKLKDSIQSEQRL